MGRNKRKPFYEQVTIEDIGAEGKALARINNLVVFTQMVVPGDVVDLQVTKKRKKYQEAYVKKIHHRSSLRVEPYCSHFGTCGGCKWQLLSYEKQLQFKEKQVYEQLRRIGKINFPEIKPIIRSDKDRFYRNKLEFTFSNNRWLTYDEIQSDAAIQNSNALGFHIPGMYDKVLQISTCWLQPEPSNKIRNFIYNYSIKNKLDFFDIKKQSGFLRTLIIRTSLIGEIMVILTFFNEDEANRLKLLHAINSEFPEITSLYYVINLKGNDTISDQETVLYSGREFIYEKMGDLSFKIGPKSFYQTNPEQAYKLYKVVKEFADLNGTEIVYDLFTGTGTIANFVARQASKVVGIEYVEEAIVDAKENARINSIENARFYSGDIKKVLNEEFVRKNGKPDVIITDPPRAGMHADVIKSILEIQPDKLVYVSCNPATQARDLQMLSDFYNVEKVQPVDMFPQTHHVENVVLATKRG